MPVVINEFEVVAEPESASSTARAMATDTRPDAAPAPIDIEHVQRFIADRAARVWAH